MTNKSRIEIDFTRLLAKCQSMVTDEDYRNEWRIEKYIETLDSKLKELQKLNVCQPSKDDLANYGKKVKFLKGLIKAEKLSSPTEKLMASQTLSSVHMRNDNLMNNDKTKEIHLQTQAKYISEVRNELLGLTKGHENGEIGLKRRAQQTKPFASSDVDAVLKYHQNMQEKVAEEMIALTQNLKYNCTVSNQIIKNDTETLERAAVLADSNYENLRQNSAKLSDFVKRSCQYWLWIMLAVVSFTFLWIICFIRIFPKSYVSK